jgi:hypothetical protein
MNIVAAPCRLRNAGVTAATPGVRPIASRTGAMSPDDSATTTSGAS